MYKIIRNKMIYIVDMVSCRYRNNIGRHKLKISDKAFIDVNAAKIYPETCNCSKFHFYGLCKHCG